MTSSNPFAANATTPAADQADTAPAADQNDAAPAAPADSAKALFGDSTGQTNVDPAALFGAARSGENHKIKDDMGCFVIVRVIEFIEGMKTQFGENDAIRADWVPVDGPNAGQVRENGLIFGRALVPAMKSNFEKGIPFTIGVVAEGQAKTGQSAPTLLNEPTAEQAEKAVEVARYLKWIA